MFKFVVQAATFVFLLQSFASGQEGVSLSLAGPELYRTPMLITSGSVFLKQEKEALRFFSNSEDNSTRRASAIKSGRIIEGDFDVALDFSIARMDHYNGLALALAAADGSWSVRFERRQYDAGNHQLFVNSNVHGQKSHKETREAALAGTLQIERVKDRLIFCFSGQGQDRKKIFECAVSASPAVASFVMWSAPQTVADININKFSIKCDSFTPNRFAPVYTNRKTVADAENGKSQLVWTEKTENLKNGVVSVNTGGRAIFALQGPINLKGPALEWVSSGALKLSVSQPGTAESIELGETLLWDTGKEVALNEVTTRKVGLGNFVNRYAWQRKWPYKYTTSNNIFFATFEPAGEEAITVYNVELSGAELVSIDLFETRRSAKASVERVKEFDTVSWMFLQDQAEWLSGLFKNGDKQIFDNVPFVLSPTVLKPGFDSVSIDVNSKAGLINIAHALGPGHDGQDPHVCTYLIVYEDGTSEAIFAELRWNCGVLDSKDFKRIKGDFTWWGPPGFTRAAAHYIPKGGGISWNSVYVAKYVNPHPEKIIKRIIAYQQPDDRHEFAVLGITLTDPAVASIGLIEPSEAAFEPEKPLRVTLMKWSPKKALGAELSSDLKMTKTGAAATLGTLQIRRTGNFSCGSAVFTPAENMLEPGPVRLRCDGIASSLLGWLPRKTSDYKQSYLTMIAGGAESRDQFERMRRLGYDAVKVHLGWRDQENPREGEFNWNHWLPRIERIIDAGLKVEFRNNFNKGPSWLNDKAEHCSRCFRDGSVKELTRSFFDMADPNFRKALVDYYRSTGLLASKYPEVISINANYGLKGGVGNKYGIKTGKYLVASFQKHMQENFPLKVIEEKTGKKYASYSELTAAEALKDESGFLITEYNRNYLQLANSLQWDVARAIRENSNAHLTFNHPFSNSERAQLGTSLEEYLKIGRTMGPGSPFHETSDRYCLSFDKWLSAKTFNLPYGDEGNQNPPTYEHNALAYQWMIWMQCWDSLYCQWWGGRPGAQNVAWMKPYFHLIYNAEYLPDPVTLSMSFESGVRETPEVLKHDRHHTTKSHYGLANTLLVCNLNPASYVMDEFPETDRPEIRLLLDDSGRYLSDEFADRLEKHIRNGGVYLTTPDTDCLRNYRFFKRFKVSYNDKKVPVGRGLAFKKSGSSSLPSLAIKNIGKGRLVMLDRNFPADFDPVMSDSYKDYMRKLLCGLTGIRPLVISEQNGVLVAPYRTREGDILVFAFNITASRQAAKIRLLKKLVKAESVCDLGSGITETPGVTGLYYSAETTINPLSSTVLKFSR